MCIRDSNICNLYTNIPNSETITIQHDMLKQNNTGEELITEITETLNVITELNYFTYNTKFFTQKNGLLMGSPISIILAEVFPQHLEITRNLANIDRHSHKIIY